MIEKYAQLGQDNRTNEDKNKAASQSYQNIQNMHQDADTTATQIKEATIVIQQDDDLSSDHQVITSNVIGEVILGGPSDASNNEIVAESIDESRSEEDILVANSTLDGAGQQPAFENTTAASNLVIQVCFIL